MLYSPCGHQLEGDDLPDRCPLCSFARKASSNENPLNDIYESQLQRAGIRGYARERKVIEGRRFRWDFAFESIQMAVEINGGTYLNYKGKKGAHSFGKQQRKNMEKYSIGAIEDWRILHFDSKDVSSGVALSTTIKALRRFAPELVQHID